MKIVVLGVAVSALGSTALAAVGYENEGNFLAAAPYATTLDNFDSYVSGTSITTLTGITSLTGVDYLGNPCDVQVRSLASMSFSMSGGTHSGDNFLCNYLDAPTYATGSITLEFASPQNALSFWVTDGSPLGYRQIDFYSGGILVDAATSATMRTDPDSFFGAISSVAFDKVVLYSTDQYDSWGIDDLRFGAVPAPATGMVALGALVGLARRRR